VIVVHPPASQGSGLEKVDGSKNSPRSHHTKCVERGEGTRFSLGDGTDICVHDNRPTAEYEVIEAPSAEAVLRAETRPPRPRKPEPFVTRHVSQKLWDRQRRVHGEPVWDDLPDRVPGQYEWEGSEILENPLREVKVICHELVISDGPSCVSHKRSAFFRKRREN
jgi:hypothetical protein